MQNYGFTFLNSFLTQNLMETAKEYNLGLNLRTAAYIVSLEKIFDTYIDAGFTIWA